MAGIAFGAVAATGGAGGGAATAVGGGGSFAVGGGGRSFTVEGAAVVGVGVGAAVTMCFSPSDLGARMEEDEEGATAGEGESSRPEKRGMGEALLIEGFVLPRRVVCCVVSTPPRGTEECCW